MGRIRTIPSGDVLEGKAHVRHHAKVFGAETALTFPAYVACIDVPLTKMASFTRLYMRGAVSSQGKQNQPPQPTQQGTCWMCVNYNVRMSGVDGQTGRPARESRDLDPKPESCNVPFSKFDGEPCWLFATIQLVSAHGVTGEHDARRHGNRMRCGRVLDGTLLTTAMQQRALKIRMAVQKQKYASDRKGAACCTGRTASTQARG